MNLEDRMKADAAKAREKLAKIKKWPARITKLSKRKADPIKEAEFCRRHDINLFRFNRAKNLKEKSLSDSFVEKVEDGFAAEGV